MAQLDLGSLGETLRQKNAGSRHLTRHDITTTTISGAMRFHMCFITQASCPGRDPRAEPSENRSVVSTSAGRNFQTHWSTSGVNTKMTLHDLVRDYTRRSTVGPDPNLQRARQAAAVAKHERDRAEHEAKMASLQTEPNRVAVATVPPRAKPISKPRASRVASARANQPKPSTRQL